MAQSDLECANGALTKLGASRITALAGTDHVSVTMNERLPICKKAVLRMHPWNFAVKRTKIYPYADFAISNVTFVSSELLEVTHAAMTGSSALVAGYWVTLEGVVGAIEANGTWEVATVPSTTVTRITAKGVTSLTTYIAGSDTIRRSPAYEYSHLYALPSDCLKVLRVNDSNYCTDWRIEGRFIATNEDSLEFKYVFDVTDYTAMDTTFYEALQTYLAHDVCYRFSQSSQLKEQLAREFQRIMGKARFDDAGEDNVESLDAQDWILARGASATSWLEVGRH